jgi:cysteine synthase A
MDALAGNTPLIHLSRWTARCGVSTRVLGKAEYFNPAGSVKDRLIKAFLDDAEAKGLRKGSQVIEASAGNTGVSLAAFGARRGLKVTLVMPETVSYEHRRLLESYGAEVVLTDAMLGMRGAVEQARSLKDAAPGAFMPEQFTNPLGVEVHRRTTGPEIWSGANGSVDIFVAGVGTGGTITGAGGFLKSNNPHVRVVAVEPAASPVLSGGRPGAHGIMGIGAGFVPDILNRAVYNEVITVSDEDAEKICADAARLEGLSFGISSGAALYAALCLAKRQENVGKTIVVMLPDGGERSIS